MTNHHPLFCFPVNYKSGCQFSRLCYHVHQVVSIHCSLFFIDMVLAGWRQQFQKQGERRFICINTAVQPSNIMPENNTDTEHVTSLSTLDVTSSVHCKMCFSLSLISLIWYIAPLSLMPRCKSSWGNNVDQVPPQ